MPFSFPERLGQTCDFAVVVPGAEQVFLLLMSDAPCNVAVTTHLNRLAASASKTESVEPEKLKLC